MAIWYEVEKNSKGIMDFLECNWCFHDFRIETIEYMPIKDMVEIFLKYDTMTHGVILRFVGVRDMRIDTQNRGEYSEWLNGSVALLLDNRSLIWLDDDGWGNESEEHLDAIKKYTTWVEADRIFWAITDADGNPVEMPSDRLHQVWVIYGKREEKLFELKPFTEDWNSILSHMGDV